MYESHPLYKAVEASTAGSASYGYGSFIETLAVYLKTFVDTPEERQRVVDVALAAYDKFLAPRLGPMVGPVLREFVGAAVHQLLANLGK